MYHYQVTARMSTKQSKEINIKSKDPLTNRQVSKEVLEKVHVSFRYLVRIEDIRQIENPERVDLHVCDIHSCDEVVDF